MRSADFIGFNQLKFLDQNFDGFAFHFLSLPGEFIQLFAGLFFCRVHRRDLFDLATKKTRPLTHLSDQSALNAFDITPDGKEIVFDRLRDNSDIVLIDLPK